MIWMFVLLLNCCFILVLQWNVEFEFMKCFFMMVIFLFFLVSLWVMVMLMILLLIIVILFFLGSFFVGILIFFCDDFYFDVFYRWFCNGYVKFVYVYFVLLGNEKGVVEQVEFVLVEVYGQVGEFFDDLQVCYVVFDDVVYFFQCDVIVVYLDVFVVEVIEWEFWNWFCYWFVFFKFFFVNVWFVFVVEFFQDVGFNEFFFEVVCVVWFYVDCVFCDIDFVFYFVFVVENWYVVVVFEVEFFFLFGLLGLYLEFFYWLLLVY